MALRNINIFEEHLEKIVLAVAGAGAIFMAYMAKDPTALPDHPEVTPKGVEPAISEQVKILDDGRAKLAQNLPNVNAGTEWVDMYRKLAGGYSESNPLEGLSSATPEFGPHNLQPNFKGETTIQEYKVVVPSAPKPEMVHAEVLQKLVDTDPRHLDPTSGLPVAPPAGSMYETKMNNVVVIDGFIPVGKLTLDLNSQTDEHKKFSLPELRRGIVYRVQVMRSELLANGQWSKFELIKPAKGSAAPGDILTTAMPNGGLVDLLPPIDAQLQQILLPGYYWDQLGQPIQPPILTRPIPDPVVKEEATLHSAIQQATQAGTGMVAVPGTPGGLGMGTPGTPATQPMLPTAMTDIAALAVQPFTFWDDSVQADHKYKYQVQVQLVNPGFGWIYGLADNNFKTEPVIPLKADGFVPAPGEGSQGEVVVHSDMAFFIQGLDFAGKLSGQIFKQVNGRWYKGIFTIDRGMDFIGTVAMGPNNNAEVNTKFTLVDYQDAGKGSLHVILKDPTGNLVSRDTAEWTNDDRARLLKRVADDEAAAAAAATAPGGATPTPTVTPLPPAPVAPGRGSGPPAPPPATTRRGPVTGTPTH